MRRADLDKAAGRFAAALVALLVAVSGCGEGSDGGAGRAGAGGPPPSVVEVHRVAARPFSDTLTVVGQLAAEESVVVRSEVAGVISRVEFAEGAPASAGDVLFTLRSEEQEADLKQARASLTLARDVHARTRELSRSAVAAQAELDRARATVLAAEAAVESAQVALARTKIRAPFDGALGARHVSPGDRVDPNNELVQIDALDRLQLQFTLPESAVALARPGLQVELEVAPLRDERFAGEVYFVSPTLDPDTRRLSMKAWIHNSARRLRPGLFARVHIEVEHADAALAIPESALVYDASGAFVWRVTAEQEAERVPVELGPRQAGTVVVRRGLSAGDAVVSAGTHKVFPGGALVLAGEPPAPVASAKAQGDEQEQGAGPEATP